MKELERHRRLVCVGVTAPRRRMESAITPVIRRTIRQAIRPAAIACLLVALVLGALAPPAAAQTDPRNPGAIAQSIR